jgi:hypothetical protein
MTSLINARVMALAAAMALAVPGLALAEEAGGPVGNAASATGNPLTRPMATTHAVGDAAQENVGNSASAVGNPLAVPQFIMQDVAGVASRPGSPSQG